MRYTALMMTAAAMLAWAAAAPVQAQSGLLTPTPFTTTAAINYWPQWQSRLALDWPQTNLLDGSVRMRSSSVLGDYYFYRHPITPATSSLGGFRATSGLMQGEATPRLLAGLGTANLTLGRTLGLNRAALFGATASPFSIDSENSTSSYLGVGYTLLSLRGGWGVSADVGLATAPHSSTTLGLGNNSGLGSDFKELRLTPLLHLGLSYSF